jgi:hypothetical protein
LLGLVLLKPSESGQCFPTFIDKERISAFLHAKALIGLARGELHLAVIATGLLHMAGSSRGCETVGVAGAESDFH